MSPACFLHRLTAVTVKIGVRLVYTVILAIFYRPPRSHHRFPTVPEMTAKKRLSFYFRQPEFTKNVFLPDR